jgi:hypothetical protein
MTHPRLAKKQAMNRMLKALLADPLCMTNSRGSGSDDFD